MRLTVRRISKSVPLACYFVLSLSLGVLTACQSQAPRPSPSSAKSPKFTFQKIYNASYDNVWRAAQLALKYPIAVNNMDHGVLETDYIKGDDGFTAPTDETLPSSGIRYKITLTLAKGKIEGRESVRVTINKAIEKKRDFFSDSENLVTDGLEEKVIFYRIERELVIDEALRKAARNSP